MKRRDLVVIVPNAYLFIYSFPERTIPSNLLVVSCFVSHRLFFATYIVCSLCYSEFYLSS